MISAIKEKLFVLSAFLYLGNAVEAVSAEEIVLYNNYIAGFVIDMDTKKGVEDVSIIISDNRNKLYSLRTMQNGWFETTSPLDKVTLEKYLKLVVLKRGYITEERTIKRMRKGGYKQDGENIIFNETNFDPEKNANDTMEIKVKSHPDYDFRRQDHSNGPNVVYGYLYNQYGDPLPGGLVTLTDKSDSKLKGSAVTRDSGYFSLFYSKNDKITGKDIELSLSHHDYTHDEGTIKIDEKKPYIPKKMSQQKHGCSFGMGTHIQYTGYDNDKESGVALTFNLAYFPGKLIRLNNRSQKYKSTGGIGIELMAGFVPYTDAKDDNGDVRHVYVWGVGLITHPIQNDFIPLQFRFGVGQTNNFGEKDEVIYAGFSIPLAVFW